MTTATSEMAIDLAHVAKTFRGKVHALRGVEMRVHRGEIYGLLGPNGAGKSTLVKILTTIVRPTKCEGTMLGSRVGHKPALRRVGYLPEHVRFPEYLNGAQALGYFGALADVPHTARTKRVNELLSLVGLGEWGGKRVKSYSKGMRQRLGIAQALMNDPELIFLDEPTDGVDPVGRRDIRNLIVRLREQGKTIFLNSHLLSELEMVCDRVAILVQGRVVRQGALDELTSEERRYEIELIETLDESGVGSVRRAVRDSIELTISDRSIRIATEDADIVQPVIDAVRAQGKTIRSVRAVRPTLEDLFIKAVTDPETGETLAPGAASERRAR